MVQGILGDVTGCYSLVNAVIQKGEKKTILVVCDLIHILSKVILRLGTPELMLNIMWKW